MLCTTHLRVFNLAFFFLRLWIEAKPFLDNVHYCLANSKLVYTQLIKAKQSVTMYQEWYSATVEEGRAEIRQWTAEEGQGNRISSPLLKIGAMFCYKFYEPSSYDTSQPFSNSQDRSWTERLITASACPRFPDMRQDTRRNGAAAGREARLSQVNFQPANRWTPGWWQPLREYSVSLKNTTQCLYPGSNPDLSIWSLPHSNHLQLLNNKQTANGDFITHLLQFLVCHGFKHFPRDSVTGKVRGVVLSFSFCEDIGNHTIALL